MAWFCEAALGGPSCQCNVLTPLQVLLVVDGSPYSLEAGLAACF